MILEDRERGWRVETEACRQFRAIEFLTEFGLERGGALKIFAKKTIATRILISSSDIVG